MSLIRRQRRVNGTRVNYWVCTETGTEYSSKAEAGRKRRSDTKPVSQNNVITLALRLLSEYEIPLVTMLEAVYAQDGDTEVLNLLRLVGACKDAVSDTVFLAAFCQPSAGVWNRVSEKALQLAYKFVLEFFPEELEHAENIQLSRFRTRRVYREYTQLDDGSGDGESVFRFASAATVDAVQLQP